NEEDTRCSGADRYLPHLPVRINRLSPEFQHFPQDQPKPTTGELAEFLPRHYAALYARGVRVVGIIHHEKSPRQIDDLVPPRFTGRAECLLTHGHVDELTQQRFDSTHCSSYRERTWSPDERRGKRELFSRFTPKSDAV